MRAYDSFKSEFVRPNRGISIHWGSLNGVAAATCVVQNDEALAYANTTVAYANTPYEEAIHRLKKVLPCGKEPPMRLIHDGAAVALAPLYVVGRECKSHTCVRGTQ